jgi:protein phosphatase
MRRHKQADGRPAASHIPQAADATLIDISRPAVGPAAAQVAGPMVITFSLATDVGRVRHNNEDYVQAERILRENRRYALWAVADGVGGGPQGEKASKTAIETVVDYLVHEPWDDPALALTQAFALANRNVYEITGEGAAASTMVAALVAEPEGVVTIANVGDSRAYIVLNGEARPITDDHSIVAARIAAGQITALEARSAPDRNVLTRSIGSETEVLVDVFGPRQLQLPERLVLCTDGVHGMIDDAALGRIAGSLPITECASALVAAAVEAGGRDNATALVGGYAPVAPVQQVAAAGAGMATGVGIGPAGAAGSSGLPPFVPSYAQKASRAGTRTHNRLLFGGAILGIGLAIIIVLGIIAAMAFRNVAPEAGASSTGPTPTPSHVTSPSAVASQPTPVPTATNTAVLSPSPSYTKYTVAKGDTAVSIAHANHITLAELEDANPGVDVSHLVPGQVLNIPVPTP